MRKSQKKLSAKKFDGDFDKGKDMSKYIDFKSMKASHPTKQVNADSSKSDGVSFAEAALIAKGRAEYRQGKGADWRDIKR